MVAVLSDFEEERAWHRWIAHGLLLQSPFIFLILYFCVDSPYGKTLDSRLMGMYTINPRIAWVVFECPNLLWCLCLYRNDVPRVNAILLGLFFIHYVQRAIVYPMLMHKNTTRMPLVIVGTAFTFCTFNGYLQAQGLCQFTEFPTHWMRTVQFWMGIVLFGVGMSMNLYHDHVLRKLRRYKQRQIPRSGLFRYVTAPHYLGEIMEWLGFCIANNCSYASVAFFIYTCANLVPRAVSHHRWYRTNFPKDYPPERKAIFPFLW